MNKILAIARTEFSNSVRSKAFIISVLMLPLLLIGSLAIQAYAGKKVDTKDRKVAIVDHSGFLYPILEDASAQREKDEVFETAEDGSQKKVQPRFVLEKYDETGDPEQTEIELSRRVKNKQLFAYLVIDEDILNTGKKENSALAYHTKTPTYDALPNWLRNTVNRAVINKRFEATDIDQGMARDLMQRVRLTKLGLAEVTKDGKVKKGERENEFKTYGIPIGVTMLLYILVMTSTPMLLNQVLEEKMQKISEVLVSSVSPFQLLMGKLFGTMGTSLTLSLLYLGAAFIAAHRFDVVDLIEPSIIIWLFVFLILALLIFGSVFSAIGAACSEIKDAQSLMTPAMIIVILPILLLQVIVQSPNGVFSTFLSLFPPFTPTLMMLRIALSPGPPLWQILLAVVLTAGCTVLCVAAAGKIFRIGILSQGKAPSLVRLAKWAFSK